MFAALSGRQFADTDAFKEPRMMNGDGERCGEQRSR